jgi:hypothetical protein
VQIRPEAVVEHSWNLVPPGGVEHQRGDRVFGQRQFGVERHAGEPRAARAVETVVVAGEILKADGASVGPHVARARELMRESRARLGGPGPVSV